MNSKRFGDLAEWAAPESSQTVKKSHKVLMRNYVCGLVGSVLKTTSIPSLGLAVRLSMQGERDDCIWASTDNI